jgi:serine/threonine-protein kinase
MRSRGPLFTLLAGLALAGVLVTLSVNASREAALTGARVNAPAANDSAQDPADISLPADEEPEAGVEPEEEAAEDGAAEDEAAEPAPAAPAANQNTTWAGRVKGGEATVAITAKGGKAIAYVCDGEEIEAWLQGTAAGGRFDLSTRDGTDSLTGTFGDGRAKGTITVGDQDFTFDVAKAKKPSGLYRTTATVRGARLVGGWIVLADGTQVGLATFAGTSVPAPPLDMGSRSATVYGAELTAQPAAPGAAW